jgi:DNA end-binding protein Ku
LAAWTSGYLRLSLVSCPIYLTPVTTRTKSIRLHQLWDQLRPKKLTISRTRRRAEITETTRRRDLIRATAKRKKARRAQRLGSRFGTGEEVEKDEVVRGYEYERGQFVTFTPNELKALDLESSKVIDLETFVPRGEVDPVYFNSPYYLYPDGQMALEAIRVIGAAMADAGVVGIGRLTMSRRERVVVVDPRGSGMVLITLRAAEEVRFPQFSKSDAAVDAEILDIANRVPVRPPAPKPITGSEPCCGSCQGHNKTNYPPSHSPPATYIPAPSRCAA